MRYYRAVTPLIFEEMLLTVLSKLKPMPWKMKTGVPMQAIAHVLSSPCTFRKGAFTVEAMATSACAAPAANHPCRACEEVTAPVTPIPAIPPIYSIYASFFFMEIVYQVSLTDCLLIPDCPYSCVLDYAMDSPASQTPSDLFSFYLMPPSTNDCSSIYYYMHCNSPLHPPVLFLPDACTIAYSTIVQLAGFDTAFSSIFRP